MTIDTAAVDGKLTTLLGEATLGSTQAAVSTLSPAQTQALLARMEPMPALDNRGAAVVRPPSAPPPRSGQTQPIAFLAPTGKVIADRPVSDVPAPGAVAPALAPPQVLPVGEVTAESVIRVRFAEPMVAIAEVGKPAALPATIKPPVAGTWRWIDTRVATFTAAAPRLPMATEFTVTVPAGVRSAVSGATLVTEYASTFTTPPVSITGTYPTVKLRPDSPLLVRFDQAIDAQAIARFLRVENAKGRKLPFELITLDEARTRWAKNPAIAHDKSELGPHYAILAPKSAWPAGISGRVVLAKAAPSREGARVSTHETGARFVVAPAFVMRGLECDFKDVPKLTRVVCPARSYVNVRFSNDIEPASYRSSKVQIAGEALEDHKPNGDYVALSTPLSVGRAYTIEIGDGIIDIYGQALGGPRRLPFATKRERHDPFLSGQGGLYVLDPRFEIPQWVLGAQSIASLTVELYQVQPADYFAYQDFERGERKTLPGKRVYSKEHVVGDRHGATARVDLRPALSASGTGHVVAVATAKPAPGKKLDKGMSRILAWIQVSRLGLTARIDGERIHAWAQDITPANFLKPIAGAATSLVVEGRTDAPAPIATDAEGHVTYPLLPRLPPGPYKPGGYPTSLILAASATDSTFSAIHGYERTQRTEQARWYVTDDRFTYKPGETVYVKGWVRWTDNGVNPDLHVPASGDEVSYQLVDAKGNRIASGKAAFTSQGGFDVEVALPANVNLGTAVFWFQTKRESIRHPISVEEFRTPAYAVNLTDDVQFSGSRPLFAGESIEMTAEAKYYAGGGLAGARIAWDVTLRSATYRPPGWDRYSFSRIKPRSERSYWGDHHGGTTAVAANESGALSGASTSALAIGIAALPRGAPSVLTVDATVTDIDRQTIRASSRNILVHPAAYYVGLRLKPEARHVVQAVVTDLDGNLVAGVPIDVAIEGVLGSELSRDDAKVIDTHSCKLVSASAPVDCAFKWSDPQTAYSATARIADPRGRSNEAQFNIPWWTTADRELAVVADKQSYKPGDIAKLEIKSKVVPAVAFVSFARQGVIVQKRVEITKDSATVELPIEPAYVRNIHVVVDRVAKRRRQSKGSALPLPEHQSTEIDLAIDAESARLAMRTRPLQPLIEPGTDATFEVEVKHDDKPIKGAEVALIVVDEAILAISGKTHADPLEPFYRAVRHGTRSMSTTDLVRDSGYELDGGPGFDRWSLDDGLHGSGTGSGYGVGSGRGGMRGRSSASPSVRIGAVVKARKDFRPTAVFSPRLETDANGKVRLTVKMPDSLTRYRVVALATASTRYFGKAENNVVVQRKVNARTVAPRFLTQGDTFSLPVVVQNLDSAPRTIDVAVRGGNLTGVGPAGKRVTVAGGQRAEVRFDFATQDRGKAVIQTIAVTNDFADASNVEVPVYTPATTESFATYGSVDDKPQFEQLAVPANIFTEVGGVEAEVSSTQLQNLTDAYWYLYAYPFECAEQRSSRMLATSAMYDILEAFATGSRPTKAELELTRAYDLKRLTRDQQSDGGWGYFRGMTSDPFVSLQVLTALAAQHDKSDTTRRAIGYATTQATTLLARLEKQVKARDVKLQRRGDDAAMISLAATALSALAAAGTDVAARAVRLHAAATALGTYPVDAKARLLAIVAGKPRHLKLRQKLLADLLSAVHETAAAATVTATYTEAERMLLVSNTKTTGLTLDALLRESPQHGLVPKIARGLLDARKGGRWRSTQENLVVLQAMRRYFDIYEKHTPNFTGKLWLGTTAYAEQAFVGRSGVRAVTHADWSMLKPGSTHDIALHKTGPGRMYFRLGITYAPKDTNLPPLDAGFIVRRTYQAVDSPSDVVQLPDGTWKIKLGARVLVRLEAINTTLRHAVALVDPLPAGFEPVNTRLATAERAVLDLEADYWDHTNMRDNRSEVFAMQLAEGPHRFSYTVRATTPGRFIAAPAKAEEMYSPETFGRSSGTVVVIE